MDHILISDLRARCVIGVSREERREKQDILINLDIGTDTRDAAQSDKFQDALDYRAIKKSILSLVENSRCHLLETLAEAIADVCLLNQKVLKVNVRVEKPFALRFARSVGVEITRRREG
ncbi:MAG: dihydroneopterin aldolase [Candidatus Aureabacteria bacterium]|nr:dihydroneopterin aldolase [Candidatus Auribacterota bacterium]